MLKVLSNIYDINFSKLVKWRVPAPIRKVFLLTWLGVLVTPIAKLHQLFLMFRKAKLYQLKITPQVCYLEMMLNDAFDFTLRRIRIVDAIWFPATYIFQEAELKSVPLFTDAENMPVIIYTDSESGNFKDDFIVLVPVGLIFNEEEMKGKINSYKLAGTKYTIQIV